MSSSASKPNRPTHARWEMSEMKAWLASLQQESLDTYGPTGSAYVHPRVLSYKDTTGKSNWIDPETKKGAYFLGDEERDTFTAPNRAQKGDSGRTVWVFLFDTEDRSYVGIPVSPEEKARGIQQHHKCNRHAWAAAIVKRSGARAGRDMYIMDVDFAADEDVLDGSKKLRKRELATGKQKVWIDVVAA